jgi:citrate lyase beta subunit
VTGGQLGEEAYAGADRRLARADAELARLWPGDVAGRQPVHTVYLPADRYGEGTIPAWGAAALAAFDEHAATPAALADATGLPADPEVHRRVRTKLEAEPVEDLRIDFEDGYGPHPDAEEDGAAEAAATVLAAAAPTFSGLRCRSLEAASRRRAIRTLDLFVGAATAGGGLPAGFRITLPKVTSVDQVVAMAEVCEQLEEAHGLAAGRLRFELQVETPQAVLGPDGIATVAPMIHAAAGRVCGLHYGTYDYSAALGIAAAEQSMEHPAADHAKAVMQVAAAGTGVRLSDGSSNLLPTGNHDEVVAAWQLHARLVLRSLRRGYYQGWDLHPAQLVSRYAATCSFFRAGLGPAVARLGRYVAGGSGGVLEEPATARALAGFVARALDCGAADGDEVRQACGLSGDDLLRLAGR